MAHVQSGQRPLMLTIPVEALLIVVINPLPAGEA